MEEKRAENYSDVIIIGAGASGLMAAVRLSEHLSVRILEARDVVGGRIRTMFKEGYSYPIELGAEFIHGDLPVTGELLKQFGINYEEVSGDFFRVSNGEWSKLEEIISGWDGLLETMKELKQDMPIVQFLETFYSGDQFEQLRREVYAYVQSFDVADPAKASVKGLLREWSGEEQANKKIKKGYGHFMEYLAAECKKKGAIIHTDFPVQEVNWQRGRVTVITTNKQQFNAGKLIITVPVSILKNEYKEMAISFFPDLPEYRKAAGAIGFGNVIKVILLFKKAFWQDKHAGTGIVISNERIPVWWTSLPFNEPVLTGFIGGPPATDLGDKSQEELLSLALTSLSYIFKVNIASLQSLLNEYIVIDWSKDPHARGAYSYPTLYSDAARSLLQSPVEQTLYFAGEALGDATHPGTVEAALSSGMFVADQILGESLIGG